VYSLFLGFSAPSKKIGTPIPASTKTESTKNESIVIGETKGTHLKYAFPDVAKLECIF